MSRIKLYIANFLSITALILLPLSGCINLASNQDKDPLKPDMPSQASYDEYGNQTAGVLGLTDDGTKFILTKLALDRYNDLIKKYRSITRLKKNEGIKPYNQYYTIELYAFYEYMRLSLIDKQQ